MLLFLCAYYPPFFRFGVRQLAGYAASRSGLRLEIKQVDGSLFEPITILNASLSSASYAGTEIHLRIARAEALFSIQNLIFHHGSGFVRKLSLDGLDGEIILSPDAASGPEIEAVKPVPRRLLPSSIEARRVNLAIHEKENLVFFQNIECKASNVNAGTVSIEKIHVTEPWLTKTFSDVRGEMALQATKISVAALELEKGLRLESASADLVELLHRRLQMDFQLSAFGGDIQGDIRGFKRENQNLNFEATGRFSGISIASLAEFLSSRETAGGTIQDGKFAFYGSLHNLRQARFSTRLAARDFCWGKRRWNSLVLGAMMVDRHLQIPDLELRQQHNTLKLAGDIAIPDSAVNWLRSDFNFNINAQIDNVTELSLLFGPDFADTAGTAAVKGSIRGEAMSFSGELEVTGSNLSFRTAPVDTLRASVSLNGNELQVTSFELARKNDFMRGKGGLNLFRDWKYWGELNASVEDVALYSAILQPAVFRQVYGGGLVLDWSGDGAAKSHSGAFHAQLKNVRPLGVTDPKPVPLNAVIEGTYSPESIFLKKFAVSDAASSFTAVIAATPESLSVESLQFKHDNTVRLEGAVLLPFNLWRAWRNLDASCWNPAGESKIDLTANKLNLHDALLLAGRENPLKGELDGKLAASGTLSALDCRGAIRFSKGPVNLAPGLEFFEGSVTMNGKSLLLEKANCRLNSTGFTAAGEIEPGDFRNPLLKLSVHAGAIPFELPHQIVGKADLDLKVDGQPASARVTGTATILNVTGGGKIDLFQLLFAGNPHQFDFSPRLNITQSPYDRWQIDLVCTSREPLKMTELPGLVHPNLRLRGSGSGFSVSGSVSFDNIPFASPAGAALLMNEATLFLPDARRDSTMADARFSGKLAGRDISGYAFGATDAPRILLMSNPPLPEPLILQLLTRGFAARSPDTTIPVLLEGLPLDLQSPFLDAAETAESFPRSSPGNGFIFDLGL